MTARAVRVAGHFHRGQAFLQARSHAMEDEARIAVASQFIARMDFGGIQRMPEEVMRDLVGEDAYRAPIRAGGIHDGSDEPRVVFDHAVAALDEGDRCVHLRVLLHHEIRLEPGMPDDAVHRLLGRALTHLRALRQERRTASQVEREQEQ